MKQKSYVFFLRGRNCNALLVKSKEKEGEASTNTNAVEDEEEKYHGTGRK